MFVGIRAASAAVGRSPVTLRRWERRGLIPPAARDRVTRARRYTEEDLANLRRLVQPDQAAPDLNR